MGRPKSEKSDLIQRFITDNVTQHPGDIVNLTCTTFGFTRQAAHKHVQKLIDVGVLEASGNTHARTYSLKKITDVEFSLPVTSSLHEDEVWRERVAPLLSDLPSNIQSICAHGFTEILNNVIDHSESKTCDILIERDALSVSITIDDTGVGIFEKIMHDFDLENTQQAIFELSKGKLTSDESRHSGEGIFFTSRAFTIFIIVSKGCNYVCANGNPGSVYEPVHDIQGTRVCMEIQTSATHTMQDIYKKFTSEHDDFAFAKTHIIIELARHEDEGLISRSQAKRIMARTERFKEVILDFRNIDSLGQGFADEIFRVFRNNHPDVKLIPRNTAPDVLAMIKHVESA